MKRKINTPHRTAPGLMRTTTTTTPIQIETDPKVIGRPIADAMRAAIEAGIRAVTEHNASGKQRWNRTGKLAGGMRVESEGNGYAIVPPDDRLNADGMIEQLIEDVPAARNPLEEPKVEASIDQTLDARVVIK